MSAPCEDRFRYFRFANPWLWLQAAHAGAIFKLIFPSLPALAIAAIVIPAFALMGLPGIFADQAPPDGYCTLRNPFLSVGMAFLLFMTVPLAIQRLW